MEAVQSEDVQVSVEEDSLEPLEDQQVEQESQVQSDTTVEDPSKTPFRGRKVTLKSGEEE